MSNHTLSGTTTVNGADTLGSAHTVTISRTGGIAVAALRISLGFVFLWAFLDKTFGFGYATPSERSWISGGSPTNGFLSRVEVGPLQSFFNDIAGTWWADWLFMLGLLGVGLALILGVGMNFAAVAGTVMMVMMWAAEWPLAQFTSTGAANGSSNPFMDYHLIYALAMIVLAVIGAGRYFGLGRWWAGVTGGKGWLR
jgi:thiosulfate dehydrogenase [quinone] large subunit